MHLPDKQQDPLTELTNQLRSLTPQIMAGLAPAGTPQTLDHTADLFRGQPSKRLFLLQAGEVQSRHQDKLIYIADAGDLLGLSRALQLPCYTLTAEDPITLIPFEWDQLMIHINGSAKRQQLWTYYLLCLCGFYRHGMASAIRPQFQPVTGFQQFSPGDTIIEQGTEADLVFTMLEGSADAIHDGVKVGEINAEEIFGALAVFTRQPRTASVVATAECSVMAVRKEDFVHLVEHQPRICAELIEEMANKINMLNNTVTRLQTG
ncbi:cyclic nucleotide-binding domain-containing protein [Exilibacterium tricleocarpae]|uniref:Cyclic nucleotide-binding domain-containing protein n=1 Tax=Exilibacterium tricleocarpae TaxID=2591008 RepID=A0A545STK1_9GAMM|nr:cyclic nucleotide-binding domain-containing protein [Exilibacterium tricleocarpae]TQV68289.1 cyclic nucleotide-binding domain-containing protein [Exilibacterium tricleocarpae]